MEFIQGMERRAKKVVESERVRDVTCSCVPSAPLATVLAGHWAVGEAELSAVPVF